MPRRTKAEIEAEAKKKAKRKADQKVWNIKDKRSTKKVSVRDAKRMDASVIDALVIPYRLGFSLLESARIVGVEYQMIKRYIQTHPEAKEKMEAAKIEADSKVVKSLYDVAAGNVEIQETETVTMIGDKEGGAYTKTTVKNKRLAPNPWAAIQWLNVRRPQDWKDDLERVEGNEELADLSDDQLEKIIHNHLKSVKKTEAPADTAPEEK